MGVDVYTSFYGRESANAKLFLLINHCTSGFLDLVMPVLTLLGGSRLVYLYFLALLVLFLLRRPVMPGRYLVVYPLGTVIGLALEMMLKQWFQVPRPFFALGADHVRVLGHFSSSWSLPSGHAVFSFMSAYALGHGRSRRVRGILYSLAVLVAWSRIYVGAHYPLDVAAGGVVGVGSGFLAWQVVDLFRKGKGKMEE